MPARYRLLLASVTKANSFISANLIIPAVTMTACIPTSCPRYKGRPGLPCTCQFSQYPIGIKQTAFQQPNTPVNIHAASTFTRLRFVLGFVFGLGWYPACMVAHGSEIQACCRQHVRSVNCAFSIAAACTDVIRTVAGLVDLKRILVDHAVLIAWLPQNSPVAWCSS